MVQLDKFKLQHEHIRCILCGQDKTTLVFFVNIQDTILHSIWLDGVEHPVAGRETIVKCDSCGLVYVNPRRIAVPGFSPYSVDQEMAYFESTREKRLAAYEVLIRQLPRWLGRNAESLLDVGAGDGVLIEAAQQASIAALGLEVSETLIQLVQTRLGVEAVSSLSLPALPAAHYDVITLINVIEHLEQPQEMLGQIVRLLRPGGVLLVHAPNYGGLPARLQGARWHQIEPLGHLYYFTFQTLSALLRKSGLEPVGRFNLITSKGLRGAAQRLLSRLGIYLDSGLGVVARRP